MDWCEKAPKAGDILRTKVTFYYHYGIFVDEGRIIQFGLPDNAARPADEVRVLATDIDAFRGRGAVEVLCLKRNERKGLRSPKETVRAAESRLGEGGYDVFHNNCAHFVCACAFKNGEPPERLDGML